MKYDMVLAGVGGQGVVSSATIISKSAMYEGYFVRQSEVHGMAQRGGAVQAQVRIADRPVESDLAAHGAVDCILGMEPVEGLRNVSYLKKNGRYITSLDPVINVPGYPDRAFIKSQLDKIPGHLAVSVIETARVAGSVHASNMVLIGMASNLLVMIAESTFERVIGETFAAKGDNVTAINIRAFRAGKCLGIRPI